MKKTNEMDPWVWGILQLLVVIAIVIPFEVDVSDALWATLYCALVGIFIAPYVFYRWCRELGKLAGLVDPNEKRDRNESQ